MSSVGFKSFPDGAATLRVFTALADHNDILEEWQLTGGSPISMAPPSPRCTPVDGIVHTMYVRRVIYPGDRLFTLLKIDEPTGW